MPRVKRQGALTHRQAVTIACVLFAASRLFLVFVFDPQPTDISWVYEVYAWEGERAAARGQSLYRFHAAEYEAAVARAAAGQGPAPLFESQWIEYPPLALRVVSLAKLFVPMPKVPQPDTGEKPPIPGFYHAFRGAVALVEIVGFAFLLWLVPRLFPRDAPSRHLERWLVYVGVGHMLGYMTYDRISLGTGVLVLLGVGLLTLRGVPALAGLAAFATAVTYQVSPAVLLPIVVLGALTPAALRGNVVVMARAAVRPALATLALVVALFLPFYWYEGPSSVGLLTFHALRQLHIEAVPATIPLFLSFFGYRIEPIGEFNCWDLASSMSRVLVVASTPLVIALVSLVAFAALRAVRRSPLTDDGVRWAALAGPAFVGFALAAYAASIAGAKAFSPQYLLWLMPLVPLAPTRRILWTFVLLAALTTAIFPYYYDDVAQFAQDPRTGHQIVLGPTVLGRWLLITRNIVLVAFAFVCARAAARALNVERRPAPARVPVEAQGEEAAAPAPAAPLRPAPRWANAALAGGGVVAALLAGELGARLLLPPPKRVSLERSGFSSRMEAENASAGRFSIANWVDFEPGFYLQTPTGRRLRANTTAVVENQGLCNCRVELKTNALGYRNREIGPKTRRRVLFLGDSITFGDYLQEDQTFVRRVEALSESTRVPLETINAGIGAVGLANELAIFTETGLGTDPDVVVLGFYLNDVEASPGIKMLSVPGILRGSVLAHHVFERVSFLRDGLRTDDGSALPAEVLEDWKRATAAAFPPGPPGDPRRDAGAFNRAIQDNFADWGSAWSEGAWRRLEPLLSELRRLCAERSIDLRIVVFPIRDQVEADQPNDYPQRRLQSVAGRLGVPVLDVLPALRAAHRGAPGTRLFFDHCHHTPEGNDLLARWILAFLAT